MKSRNNPRVKVNLPKFSIERFENIPLLKLFYVSLLLSILTIVATFILKNHLPPEVPLYYGLPVSDAQLAASSKLMLPGLLALVVVSVNLLLAILIDDKFLKQSLIIAGFAVSFFSAITTIKIILLVGNL